MWLLLAGVLMLIMNLVGIGPIGAWTWSERWWAFLLPFALAVAWWTWSDWSGRTGRQAMAKLDAKRAQRRQKNLESLGMKDTRKRR